MASRDPRIYFDPPKPRRDEAITRSGKEDSGSSASKYLGKVAMLIPAEIIAGYQFAMGLVGSIPSEVARPWIYRGSFVLGAIFTALYIAKRMTEQEKKKHLSVYVLAFVIWAYGLSAQHLLPEGWWSHESARGLVLLFGSLWLGLFDLPEKAKQSGS